MNKPSEIAQIARDPSLFTKELPALVGKGRKKLDIGMPKERSPFENRVALKPSSVAAIVGHGHDVVIESGAGKGANFSDGDYSEAGARIAYDSKQAFEAGLVVKVDPPVQEEVAYLNKGAALISTVQTAKQSAQYLESLNKKKIIALGYEFIQDKVGGLPLMRAMSEIAGSSTMMIAAEYLSSAKNGRGVILGGITGVAPTTVVILGSGTVAEFAARSALGLGADVRIFDDHLYKLRRLKHSLGKEVFTSTFDAYRLEKEILNADVLIGAIRADKGQKMLVTEELVTRMKQGSVIIDVSIDHGGCIETSELTNHARPTFVKHEVTHYCVPNIASRVARTASLAISNILTPIILEFGEQGGIEDMIFNENWLMKGVYTYKGSLTNLSLAKRFNMPYKDFSLFMAARF